MKSGGALRAIKNAMATSGTWTWLVYLESTNPDTGAKEAHRFTTNNEVVEWGEDTVLDTTYKWKPAPLRIGVLEDSSTGSLRGFEISVGNVYAALMGDLLARDFLAGENAELILINTTTAPGDQTSAVILPATVGRVSADEKVVKIQLSSENLYEITTPLRVIVADGCDNAYGGEVCQFPIDILDPGQAVLGPCNKRRQDCRARGALAAAASFTPNLWPRQFGAFPGVDG